MYIRSQSRLRSLKWHPRTRGSLVESSVIRTLRRLASHRLLPPPSSAVLLRAVGCGLDGVGVATSRSTALPRVGVSWSGIRAVGAGRFSRYGRSVGGPLSASMKAALPLLDPLLCGGMLVLIQMNGRGSTEVQTWKPYPSVPRNVVNKDYEALSSTAWI